MFSIWQLAISHLIRARRSWSARAISSSVSLYVELLASSLWTVSDDVALSTLRCIRRTSTPTSCTEGDIGGSGRRRPGFAVHKNICWSWPSACDGGLTVAVVDSSSASSRNDACDSTAVTTKKTNMSDVQTTARWFACPFITASTVDQLSHKSNCQARQVLTGPSRRSDVQTARSSSKNNGKCFLSLKIFVGAFFCRIPTLDAGVNMDEHSVCRRTSSVCPAWLGACDA